MLTDISNILRPIDAMKVNSVEELFSIIVSENKKGDKWFRGQADINYPLLPSVIRQAHIIRDQFGRRVRPHPIEIFSTYADTGVVPDGLYINSFKNLMKNKHIYEETMSDMEFLCLAQHYGVRTRLLDWSTDAIVAMFFALDKRKTGVSAGFYILDPVKFNKTTCLKELIYNIDNVPDSEDFPIAFYGPKNDMRMCRQSGNFTIHGSIFWPIDYLYPAKEFLKRIEIPETVCSDLENMLKGLGITRKSIYVMDDEKDKFAQEARNLTEQIFEEQLRKWIEEWEKDSEKGIENHIYF